jgi:hypothetical protein
VICSRSCDEIEGGIWHLRPQRIKGYRLSSQAPSISEWRTVSVVVTTTSVEVTCSGEKKVSHILKVHAIYMKLG